MRTQIILLSAAGALGLVFAMIRPAPNTGAFWLIVTPGVFCVIYNSIIDNRRRKQEVSKYKIWHARLMELVDIDDFENDGHLNEWFTDAQWTQIFKELESMPKGSRSLKQAIETVVPEIKNEAQQSDAANEYTCHKSCYFPASRGHDLRHVYSWLIFDVVPKII